MFTFKKCIFLTSKYNKQKRIEFFCAKSKCDNVQVLDEAQYIQEPVPEQQKQPYQSSLWQPQNKNLWKTAYVCVLAWN